MVAAWRAGSGRVLCYTGEADGKYAGPITKWKDIGDWYTSLVRWVAGPVNRLPPEMMLTQDVKNGLHSVRLHLDPEREGNPFAELPRVTLLRSRIGQRPEVQRTTLNWTGADLLDRAAALQGRETLLATVTVPGHEPVALPPVCLPYSPEFQPAEKGRGLAALEQLSRASGGKERLELASVWKELPRYVRLVSLAPVAAQRGGGPDTTGGVRAPQRSVVASRPSRRRIDSSLSQAYRLVLAQTSTLHTAPRPADAV